MIGHILTILCSQYRFMGFYANSNIVCYFTAEPRKFQELYTSAKMCKFVASDVETWPQRDQGEDGVIHGELLWPKWQFVLVVTTSDKRGLPPEHKFITWAWHRPPGVKSLLSTEPGAQETDDAKEAAQCLSTRTQSILQSSVWHHRLDKYLYKRKHVGTTSVGN